MIMNCVAYKFMQIKNHEFFTYEFIKPFINKNLPRD